MASSVEQPQDITGPMELAGMLTGRFCRAFTTLLLIVAASGAAIGEDRFARTGSRGQYVHRIPLYDANKQLIDPTDPNAAPYSPTYTCGKCHDYKTIAHGWHFNAADMEVDAGRPGEPWIWTDARTGTQIPLSYRDWAGTWKPSEVGMSAWKFVETFGRHLPGGGPGEQFAVDSEDARWKLSGKLAIDCMICHADNRSYSHDAWVEQIENHNFAWAPTAAMGLGHVEGSVSRLPESFDPGNPPEGKSLPKVDYYEEKFDAEKQVFFDVVRRPPNNNCYYCHTQRPVGTKTSPDWNHDSDVHLRAGMSCVDCHRNGIAHDTVRGYPGEPAHDGVSVASLSCVGCHVGIHDGDQQVAGGRLGAPEPQHLGIPPLHFESISCTACHAGPLPRDAAGQVQTSMAHKLGLPSQTRNAGDQPVIAAPVFMRDAQGLITPNKVMWPAFWGQIVDGEVTPIDPDTAYRPVRSALRVRRDMAKEVGDVRISSSEKAEVLGEERAKVAASKLTAEEQAKLDEFAQKKAAAEFREKIIKALEKVGKEVEGKPVYVSGGKLYELNDEGKLKVTDDHSAAKPYAWPMAHDVRPARLALGAGGRCTDCHSADSNFTRGFVQAAGPAPDDTPPTASMAELQGLNPQLWAAWDQSFMGRPIFKVIAILAICVLGLSVLLFALRSLNGVSAWLNRSEKRPSA